MRAKAYLQLSYPTTREMEWISRILTRIHQSSSETLKQRLAAWNESGLGELALIISTRSAVLRHILLNLAREMSELERKLRRRKGDVREAIVGGHGIPVGDSPFKLMLFADAFLFESKAAAEFIRDFVKCFFESIFGESLSNSELAKRFAANDVPIEWLDRLKDERDFLLHNGGTWPVLEALDELHERFDLVLLKRISYTGRIEEKDTIHFNKLRDILAGFQRAVAVIEELLISEIGNFEKRVPAGPP